MTYTKGDGTISMELKADHRAMWEWWKTSRQTLSSCSELPLMGSRKQLLQTTVWVSLKMSTLHGIESHPKFNMLCYKISVISQPVFYSEIPVRDLLLRTRHLWALFNRLHKLSVSGQALWKIVFFTCLSCLLFLPLYSSSFSNTLLSNTRTCTSPVALYAYFLLWSRHQHYLENDNWLGSWEKIIGLGLNRALLLLCPTISFSLS